MRRSVASSVFPVLLLSVVLAACGGGDEQWAGSLRNPAPTVGVDLQGTSAAEPFEFRAQPGNVLLVYFGYTSCPDVCPTTLADVASARTTLIDDADRVDLVMVTVDPNRDSDEVLSAYVGSFVADAAAVRTEDDAALQAAAQAFGVFYDVSTLDDGTIDVVHSGSLFAVDDEGRIVVSWPFGTPIDDLANDLELLLEAT